MENVNLHGKSRAVTVTSLFMALGNHREKKGEAHVILMHPNTHKSLVDDLRMTMSFDDVVSYDTYLTCQGVKIMRTEDIEENHFKIY